MVAFRASLDGSAAFGEFEQVALDHSDLVAEFDGVDGVEAVVEGSVLGWGERVGVVAKEPVGWGCGGVVAFGDFRAVAGFRDQFLAGHQQVVAGVPGGPEVVEEVKFWSVPEKMET